MTAHAYAGSGSAQLQGHPVEVLWSNRSPDHLFSEVS